jgi:hypothetical protein
MIRSTALTLFAIAMQFSTATNSRADNSQNPYSHVDTSDSIFDEADRLFAEREQGRTKVGEARASYSSLLDRVSGDQLVHAVAQLGRLAIYEGEMLLPKTATAERREIFQNCWCKNPRRGIGGGSCQDPGFVDRIKTIEGKEHPAYFYFKGACLAYWMEIAGPLEKVAFIGQLESALTQGINVNYDLVKGTDYEGGGLLRIAAGVHSNPASAALGYHRPEEAYNEVNRALAAPASIGDPNSGDRYFGNHQMKANVFIQLDKKFPDADWMSKGIEFTNQTLLNMTDMIDFDTFPAGRKPEFLYNYRMLKEHYRTMTGDEWNP